MRRQLTAVEAAARLGVKVETLYAYVSRGLLHPERSPAARASLFDAGEVERLALKGRGGARRRDPAERTELVVESALTAITESGHFYRGVSALTLARTRSFEAVAEWLWTGAWPDEPPRWAAPVEAVRVARAATAVLPPVTLPLDRLRVAAAAVAAVDHLRFDTRPEAVVVTARSLLASLVAALQPAAGAERPDGDSIGGPAADGRDVRWTGTGTFAEQVWTALGGVVPPEPGLLRALNAALVLLADHELAASTVAARIAASARADPYAVVGTGLGAVSGALQAGASLSVEALFARAEQPADAPRLLGDYLRRGDPVPGFGHVVLLYRQGDPRAAVLLDLVREARPDPARLAVPEALLGAMADRRLPPANIDFAVATLTHAAGLTRGAGEAIFALARTAGWLAHAIEEYSQRTRFRPRAIYVGPAVENGR